MDEENEVEFLQRYRRDRHVLLEFILSGSLIKKVVMPPGAVSLDDVDLDQVCVDYVLNCAKKGGLLELSEAIRNFHDVSLFPSVKHNDAGSTSEFFLVTDPGSSGPPPKRGPPPVPVPVSAPIMSNHAMSEPIDNGNVAESEFLYRSQSLSSSHPKELTIDDIEDFEDDCVELIETRRYSRRVQNDASDFVLRLPSFATGLTDDDLRETAYEILLAAAGASGGLIIPSKEKKKEKKSSLMKKLVRSRSDNVAVQPHQPNGLVGLLEALRVQMEISEQMDFRVRHGLLSAMVGKVGKRMDSLLIPVELLCCISRTEFSDKKSYIKWQKRQLNILEEGLINHPVVGFGETGRKGNDLRILLAKIEESETLPSGTGDIQRAESLRSIRDIATQLSERPARGDLTGEICHWADGYHLNVRLYEKLLFSVFDVLDESKLTEEVEEMLELFKSTWHILGITETIHYTCYSWVLFRQFVVTNELDVLPHVVQQLKRIPLKDQRGPTENLHLKTLSCRVTNENGSQELTFLQSFLLPILNWVDTRLADYHFHFAEGSKMMESMANIAVVARRLLAEEPQLSMQGLPMTDTEQLELYVSSSTKHAFSRISQDVEALSDISNEHPLAILAEHAKKVLKRETVMYLPILISRHRAAGAVSASLIHKLYGIKLKPFLDSAEHLTEDAVSVFRAADDLERNVTAIILSTCEEGTAEAYRKKLNLYKIEIISGTLVLRWINSQLGRIASWTERVFHQENWLPVSTQQRHGSSIVEFYRIVEETVDQFFALDVPMRPGELTSLFHGIDNAFKVYVKHVLSGLADKEDIIPPVPILTRYKKESSIKSFVKKELTDAKLPEYKKSRDISVLTTPTLCVQLNSLYYAISHLKTLEDSIWERWSAKHNISTNRTLEDKSRNSAQNDSFNGSRKDINAAIDRFCEFAGIKTIFWDLREAFIDGLYKPSVAHSRLESLVEPLDLALNQLCDYIMEPLRDRVVTGLLQATLDGLIRVILDGGPSRMFTHSDAKLLEEDLEVLKEFFISGGDGLPRGVVENHLAHIRNIVKLHNYETRELIEDLRSASEMELQGGRSRLGTDAKTLIRILGHRIDSEASQFLKKQYKIPKSIA